MLSRREAASSNCSDLSVERGQSQGRGGEEERAEDSTEVPSGARHAAGRRNPFSRLVFLRLVATCMLLGVCGEAKRRLAAQGLGVWKEGGASHSAASFIRSSSLSISSHSATLSSSP